MTASLLRSILQRALVPTLLASCFIGAGAGCDDDSDDEWDAEPDYGDGKKCNRRYRPGGDNFSCPDFAHFVLNAPGATRAGVDPNTLWVRACINEHCTDQPLFSGQPELDRGEGSFGFDLDLRDQTCSDSPAVAAISLYDTFTNAPLYTDVREVSLLCSGSSCRVPAIEFSAPDDSFRCEPRGALIGLRAPEAIPLPEGASPIVVVCVDGLCSAPITLPTSRAGIDPGLSLDVLVQGVERSNERATQHKAELVVSSDFDAPPFRETFELLLNPAVSFACETVRSPDLEVPLRPEMFVTTDPGGGRPPPYEPGGEGGSAGAGGEGGEGGAAGTGGAGGAEGGTGGTAGSP